MDRREKNLFLCFFFLLGALAIAGAIWWHQAPPNLGADSGKSQSIVSPQSGAVNSSPIAADIPLKNALADSSSANASGLESSQRIYRSIAKCFWAAKNAELADGQMRQAQLPNKSADERREAFARAEKFLKESSTLSSLCDGVPYEDLVNNIYPSLLSAAQLGDEDAAVCYVRAVYPTKRGESQSYQQNAWQLIREGLERGDWRVVDVLMDLYGDSNTGRNWFYSLAQRNPAQYYQYAKLLSLGATGVYGDWAKKVAEGEATLISQDDIAKGDAFAADMYQKYFSKAPPLTKKPDYPCQFSST